MTTDVATDQDVGITVTGEGSSTLPTTVAALRALTVTGSTLGAQVTVMRAGRIVADVGVGQSRLGRPARPDDVFRLYCLTKPIVAVCVLQARQAGKLSLDDPVWRHVDMLRSARRDEITIAGLLTHSSGLPHQCVDPDRVDFGEAVRRAGHTPISPAGWWNSPRYNMSDSWHLLAAVLQNVYEDEIANIIRTQVVEPLELRELRLADPDPTRFVPLHRQVRSGDHLGFEPIDEPVPRIFDRPNPAYGGFGTANDIVTFYGDLLACLRGHGRLLTQESAEQLVTPRTEVDLFNGPLRPWGLGVNLAIARHVLSGAWSDRAFGHPSSFDGRCIGYAFADPDTDTAVCIRWHGIGARTNRAMYTVAGRIHADLSLVEDAGR